MFIKEYISTEYPVFDPSDSISLVKERLRDFDYSHLFLVNNHQFIGALSRNLLEQTNATVLSELAIHSERIDIPENSTILDSIRYFYTFNSNIIPVVNKEDNYLGTINTKDVFKDLSKYPLFSENAAVLIVETSTRNYSMTEVAQIVENNRAKFYGSFIYRMTDDVVQLVIKISPADMLSIESDFDRFGYLVLHRFYKNERNEVLKDRFDFLQKYMEL